MHFWDFLAYGDQHKTNNRLLHWLSLDCIMCMHLRADQSTAPCPPFFLSEQSRCYFKRILFHLRLYNVKLVWTTRLLWSIWWIWIDSEGGVGEIAREIFAHLWQMRVNRSHNARTPICLWGKQWKGAQCMSLSCTKQAPTKRSQITVGRAHTHCQITRSWQLVPQF